MLAAFIVAVQNTEDVKAKNPILPEGKEIVWAVIAFAIVFGLLAWKAWPAIKKALKDREDRIRGDLERAESARVEAEQRQRLGERDAEEHGGADRALHLGLAGHRLDRVADHEADADAGADGRGAVHDAGTDGLQTVLDFARLRGSEEQRGHGFLSPVFVKACA